MGRKSSYKHAKWTNAQRGLVARAKCSGVHWLTWFVIGLIVLVFGYILFSESYRYDTLMTAVVAGAMLITGLWRQRSGRFQPANSLLLTDVESLAG